HVVAHVPTVVRDAPRKFSRSAAGPRLPVEKSSWTYAVYPSARYCTGYTFTSMIPGLPLVAVRVIVASTKYVRNRQSSPNNSLPSLLSGHTTPVSRDGNELFGLDWRFRTYFRSEEHTSELQSPYD